MTKTIREFIDEIKVDRSNLEHIANSGKINGSLLTAISVAMQGYHEQFAKIPPNAFVIETNDKQSFEENLNYNLGLGYRIASSNITFIDGVGSHYQAILIKENNETGK